MIKYYCDLCGTEVEAGAGTFGRITRMLDDKLMVQVIVGLSPGWNCGIFCQPCILRAVLEGVDITGQGRVREEP